MQNDKIYPKECPICGISTNSVSRITEPNGNVSSWFNCNCGVIFQDEKPKHGCYNQDYLMGYANYKECDLVQVHAAKTYASVIEECTYGRKMLDVGFNLPQNMHFFRERGWITTGIDINPTLGGENGVITGSFEEYDKFEDKYDLIWMSHVFEHFNDPIAVLKKVSDLLTETGVLYLSTPDIDFINKTGVSGFPHWNKNEHYIMWSERALVRELERLDFNVVVKRRNYSSRFTSWHDLQIIAQKRYF
jgi:SAM-dependent methyltransferase